MESAGIALALLAWNSRNRTSAALAALSYFQQVNGKRCSGAVRRLEFGNSLIS